MLRRERGNDTSDSPRRIVREAGDWVIWAGEDEESGVSWVGTARRSGPFALNWRRILYGVTAISSIMAMLPIFFWLGEHIHEASKRLPAPWQPFVQWLWVGLTIVFVILVVIVHPIKLLGVYIGALVELINRFRDWLSRHRTKRDPEYLSKAISEVISELADDGSSRDITPDSHYSS